MTPFFLRFLTSRFGLSLVVCCLLWGWHVYDKRQAVQAAREGYVQQFELSVAQAELDALRRRAVAAEQANQALQQQIKVAEGDAQRFAQDLEAFKRETKVNPNGIVDADLLRRLRAN